MGTCLVHKQDRASIIPQNGRLLVSTNILPKKSWKFGNLGVIFINHLQKQNQ
jgi:hypothetical protein